MLFAQTRMEAPWPKESSRMLKFKDAAGLLFYSTSLGLLVVSVAMIRISTSAQYKAGSAHLLGSSRERGLFSSLCSNFISLKFLSKRKRCLIQNCV